MKKSLTGLTRAATQIILPGQSAKFRAAIFAPNQALVLQNNGKLQVGESPDSRDLRDLEFNPTHPSATVIPRSYPDFSSESWSEFLSFLNPTIVKNLKPQENIRRHLLDVYNPCLSDNATVSRNRSSVFGSLPLTRHLLHRDDFAESDYETRRLECLQNIDVGAMSPAQLLQKYFESEIHDSRWTTDRFLFRMAFAPDLQSVRSLGESLMAGAKVNHKFDEGAYKAITQHIPYSHLKPEEFEKMWRSFEDVRNLHFSAKSTSQLLVNIGGNWEKNKIRQAQKYDKKPQDYFNAVARDLLLPIFFTKLRDAFAARGETLPNDLENLSQVEDAAAAMRRIAQEKITTLLTPSTLEKLVDQWKISRPTIDSLKPLIKNYSGNPDEEKKSAWHALMPNQTIDGINYVVLTNQSDLNREADKMDHCIGGYAMLCRSGECHIISGSTASGENFTLDLRRLNEGQFRIHQLSGFRDHECSEEVERSAENLLHLINSGQIIVNQKSGALTEATDLKTWLQFDPLEVAERQSVFKAYRDSGALPSQWLRYESLDELVSQNGVAQEIDERVRLESASPKNLRGMANEELAEITPTQPPSPPTQPNTNTLPRSHRSLARPQAPEIAVVELFSEKKFSDLFEELPPPPEGRANFVRVISKAEIVGRAQEDPAKTESKNTRYVRAGQTTDIDQLGLLRSRNNLLSGNISFLFEVDIKAVSVVTDSFAIGNSGNSDNLLYFQNDAKNGISSADKLKKLTSALNDCMVSISSQDYKKAALLLPSKTRIAQPELAGEILEIFAMQRATGNSNPTSFVIETGDKIFRVRSGQEEVIEKILREKFAQKGKGESRDEGR